MKMGRNKRLFEKNPNRRMNEEEKAEKAETRQIKVEAD